MEGVKLYYSINSCGATNFINAYLSNVDIACEQVNLKASKTASGKSFVEVNHENVPTVVMKDGDILCENIACLQYIADLNPIKKENLCFEYGSKERYMVINYLSWIATELHARYGPLAHPIEGDARIFCLNRLKDSLKLFNECLDGRKFLVGDRLSSADLYLHIVLSWLGALKIDVASYPKLYTIYKNISNLENVKAGYELIKNSPKNTLGKSHK